MLCMVYEFMKGLKSLMHVKAFDTMIRRWRKVALRKAFSKYLNLLFYCRKQNDGQNLGLLPTNSR